MTMIKYKKVTLFGLISSITLIITGIISTIAILSANLFPVIYNNFIGSMKLIISGISIFFKVVSFNPDT